MFTEVQIIVIDAIEERHDGDSDDSDESNFYSLK